MSKDSLIKGTLILALAAFIARFLGLIQRVPLKHLLEDSGMATYGIAYNIYFLLLIVATAGIPSALSKLISERTALGRYEEANRIYGAALLFAAVAGVVITVVLYAVAPYYAVYISKDEDAALAIRALAPAMLLFPVIAIMRGYFQGRQMMKAGGLSQIVEQIARVLTAVGLAYFLLWLGYSHRWAIAGASFGGVTGSVGAFAVMLYYWRKLKKADVTKKLADSRSSVERAEPYAAPLPMKQIYSMIFKLSIPISLISLAVPVIYFIDSSTVITLLEGHVGYDAAKETLGILAGRAQSFAGIPPILAIALSMSIVPVISSAFARKDEAEVKEKASQALKISVLSGLPLVLVLFVAARPLNGLLFGDEEGTWIIVLLTAGSMFQIMMMTSGAILMGLGQTKAPMIHVFIGIGIKAAGSFLLAPWLGIYGIILATTLCFIVTMQLNLMKLRKEVGYTVLGKRWGGMMLASALMMGTGIGLDGVSGAFVAPFGNAADYALQSLLIGSVVMAMYPLLLIAFGVVTDKDLRMLPSPLQKGMAQLLRIVKRA